MVWVLRTYVSAYMHYIYIITYSIQTRTQTYVLDTCHISATLRWMRWQSSFHCWRVSSSFDPYMGSIWAVFEITFEHCWLMIVGEGVHYLIYCELSQPMDWEPLLTNYIIMEWHVDWVNPYPHIEYIVGGIPPTVPFGELTLLWGKNP